MENLSHTQQKLSGVAAVKDSDWVQTFRWHTAHICVTVSYQNHTYIRSCSLIMRVSTLIYTILMLLWDNVSDTFQGLDITLLRSLQPMDMKNIINKKKMCFCKITSVHSLPSRSPLLLFTDTYIKQPESPWIHDSQTWECIDSLKCLPLTEEKKFEVETKYSLMK